ncbi:uncharacterized protein LOC119726205 [Patiria miniata]|uniref:Uncharacterized protein n=1 Tax=Patiria miniata TaxID=46514 RepID=A0A913ZQU0_PATMI|nr:uncharacterized protein LOC119726205 [Patiria miniata]XP_038053744.1 uncharacterized protein LOC119726205 [Patiria miniata]
MRTTSPAVLLSVMIVMAAVVMPTVARVKGRKNCRTRAGKGVGCNSSVSFFKRLLDEKYRELKGQQDPEVRGDDPEDKMLLLLELLRDEKRGDSNLGEKEDEPDPETRGETDDLEEKMLLLRELLLELNDT